MLVPASARAGPCGPWPVRPGTTQTGRMVIDRRDARASRASIPQPARPSSSAVAARADVASRPSPRRRRSDRRRTLSVTGRHPSRARCRAAPSADADPALDADASASITTLGSTITFYGRGAGHGVGHEPVRRPRPGEGRRDRDPDPRRVLPVAPGPPRPTRPQVVRVLLLDREPATTASPLVIHGRGGAWTHRRPRRHLPGRRRSCASGVPDGRRSRTTSGPGARSRSSPPTGRPRCSRGAVATTVVVRPAEPGDPPPARRQARGARHVSRRAQGRPRRELGPRRQPRRPRRLPARRAAGRDAVELARRGAAGPGGRRAQLRRAAAAPGLGRLRPLRRHPLAGLPRRRGRDRSRPTRSSTPHPGAILVKGRHDRAINAFYHSTGGGATENNEYAFVGASGAVTASPVAYLRGFADRDRATARPSTRPRRTTTWSTASLTRAQLSSIFAQGRRGRTSAT